MALVAWVAGIAAADTAPPVGFANAAVDAEAAAPIIESLRLGIANEGMVALDDADLVAALEQPLAARGSIDAALVALAAAKEAYAGFEYDAALAALARVDKALGELPTTDKVLEVAADRHLLAGLIHAGRNAEARAMESFRVVSRIDPDRAELDRGVYAPALVDLYRRALASDVGRVDVELAVSPAGAELWLDGARLPAGRRALAGVDIGLHRVAVTAPDHRGQVKMIEITPRSRRVVVTLEAMSTAERIRDVRRQLARADVAASAWQAAAARLSRLAGAGLLVMVRPARGDGFEAAIFRPATGRLGSWIPVPSARFFSALHPPVRREVPAGALRGDADRATDDRSWYQTWWGKGLIVGAGVLAVGGVVYAVTASGDDGVDIGGWCFGQECQ